KPVIFLFVAILIFCAVIAFYLWITLRRKEQSTKLLRERIGVPERQESWVQLQVERDERLSAIPIVDRILKSLAVARRLELMLYQAGMTMRVGSFLLTLAVMASIGYAIGVGVFHHVLHGLVLAPILGFSPFMFVSFKKSARQRQFAEEFPDALDLLV